MHKAAAGSLIEERPNAEVADSIVPCVRTAATLDVEPSWLRHRNAYKNNNNHVARRWKVVAFFALKTTQTTPPTTASRPKIHSVDTSIAGTNECLQNRPTVYIPKQLQTIVLPMPETNEHC